MPPTLNRPLWQLLAADKVFAGNWHRTELTKDFKNPSLDQVLFTKLELPFWYSFGQRWCLVFWKPTGRSLRMIAKMGCIQNCISKSHLIRTGITMSCSSCSPWLLYLECLAATLFWSRTANEEKKLCFLKSAFTVAISSSSFQWLLYGFRRRPQRRN